MAYIIYQTNKKTGIKYAYRSESYRDPETKKPKSRRTYLGRVDPITNEIIPKADTGKRNRSPVVDDSVSEEIRSELRTKNNTIKQLEQQVSTCRTMLEDMKHTIDNTLDKLSNM